ncbi:hypothetical protein Ancab_016796 [Ancistrocladus abbreviatus]
MLLRKSIAGTKKFFRETLQSFKCLFSRGGDHSYERLPRTSPAFNPFSCGPCAVSMDVHPSYQNLDKFGGGVKLNCKEEKMMMAATAAAAPTQGNKEAADGHDRLVNCNEKRNFQREMRDVRERERQMKLYSGAVRERRLRLVAERLKVLEMVDNSNVDHALDIEEVLHYYSRLTCPAYVDIVDKFFAEIFAETFTPQAIPQGSNSRPKLQHVKF